MDRRPTDPGAVGEDELLWRWIRPIPSGSWPGDRDDRRPGRGSRPVATVPDRGRASVETAGLRSPRRLDPTHAPLRVAPKQPARAPRPWPRRWPWWRRPMCSTDSGWCSGPCRCCGPTPWARGHRPPGRGRDRGRGRPRCPGAAGCSAHHLACCGSSCPSPSSWPAWHRRRSPSPPDRPGSRVGGDHLQHPRPRRGQGRPGQGGGRRHRGGGEHGGGPAVLASGCGQPSWPAPSARPTPERWPGWRPRSGGSTRPKGPRRGQGAGDRAMADRQSTGRRLPPVHERTGCQAGAAPEP